MALKYTSHLGFPVVLKLSAPSLVHKTEAGGVLLNLEDLPGVAAAYRQLADDNGRFRREKAACLAHGNFRDTDYFPCWYCARRYGKLEQQNE